MAHTLVRPGGPAAPCRVREHPDGCPHIISVSRFRGYAAKPRHRKWEIKRCHPGIYIPGRGLPSLPGLFTIVLIAERSTTVYIYLREFPGDD
ncbi:hypothetical protein LF1_38760 [Rubripirellula obstinata]|uniref:Uncharacterized protein n=1 Tax=Rubripirellula obstinata TaxID=406547 RepID=A0A5B1CNF9_9BACT|nr:hypothetical protein LF1_38760 [Rubripirellula obstinata]